MAALCVNKDNAERLVTTMFKLHDTEAAHINEKNIRAQTALHLASTAGNAGVVRVIMRL